jgi:hypothetical protein
MGYGSLETSIIITISATTILDWNGLKFWDSLLGWDGRRIFPLIDVDFAQGMP